MAKNVVKGGRRRGTLRNRTPSCLPNGHYERKDRRTGAILGFKADRTPYQGVVIEKIPPFLLATQPVARPSPRRVALQSLPGKLVWRPREVIHAEDADPPRAA